MNILEVYKKYQIMPPQAEHQLTVAAVADFICGHFKADTDRRNIVAASLLHDMGNIVKFDLQVTDRLYPKSFKADDIKYWQQVKQEFIEKYGTGSHNVTTQIVRELGVNERIRELVDCVGFNQGVDNCKTTDFGKKICAYSDMRVMPRGVASLEERMADLRVRYQNHFEVSKQEQGDREKFENALHQIQHQIFKYCNIKPEDISEESVKELKEKLKNFDI